MGPDVEGLPKAIVRRVVKDKLSRLSDDGDINLHKDALLAFSEGARIFIHYLSATANDICKEAKRQTINADDVLKALEEIEFSEFVRPLRVSLDEYRKINAGKRAGAAKEKEATKSKKQKVEPAENGHHEEAEEEGSADQEREDSAEEGNGDDEANDSGEQGEDQEKDEEDSGEQGEDHENEESSAQGEDHVNEESSEQGEDHVNEESSEQEEDQEQDDSGEGNDRDEDDNSSPSD